MGGGRGRHHHRDQGQRRHLDRASLAGDKARCRRSPSPTRCTGIAAGDGGPGDPYQRRRRHLVSRLQRQPGRRSSPGRSPTTATARGWPPENKGAMLRSIDSGRAPCNAVSTGTTANLRAVQFARRQAARLCGRRRRARCLYRATAARPGARWLPRLAICTDSRSPTTDRGSSRWARPSLIWRLRPAADTAFAKIRRRRAGERFSRSASPTTMPAPAGAVGEEELVFADLQRRREVRTGIDPLHRHLLFHRGSLE